MAKFLSNGTPDVDITIIKDTEVDRKSLINLKNHEKLGDGVDLIYMYSLENEQINYPKQDGNILYIGEAGRQKKTGTRFTQHISTEATIGGDTGTNYTLSYYYWSGKKIRLKIFILDTRNDSKSRKNTESQIIRLHLKKYGSHPIAQGASGENYTVSSIEKLEAPCIIEQIITSQTN
ncbi:hypothetical protein [Stutzerimonas stutzeri]|uniref:hypothetical protein n=1 Tax=Stutzerimonas stutzeri TaxID=316 RepID=UPI000F772D0E|nr:hypothetical protein [Stutzerimonas stutzeri]MDH0424160.1 hypothetical protein [Stutzerimonas stutzeri]